MHAVTRAWLAEQYKALSALNHDLYWIQLDPWDIEAHDLTTLAELDLVTDVLKSIASDAGRKAEQLGRAAKEARVVLANRKDEDRN